MASSPKIPWVSICVRPRAVMREVLDRPALPPVTLLAGLFGVSLFLESARRQSLGEALELPWILLLAIGAGPLLGVLELLVISALLTWTGAWLGGRASVATVRVAVALGRMPLLWLSLLWIPAIVVAAGDAFRPVRPAPLSASGDLPLGVILAVGAMPLLLSLALVLFIWVVTVAVGCLGEAQGFGGWRTIANYLMAYGLLVFCAVLGAVSVAVLLSLWGNAT